MTGAKQKSRTFRRVYGRTPGGRIIVKYSKRKPSKAVCGVCGAVLNGVARQRNVKLRNMPKTKKRPQRAFAGVLCSRCARKEIKKRARK